jgi:hypothetical protein
MAANLSLTFRAEPTAPAGVVSRMERSLEVPMKKILTAGMAALTLGASVATGVATPAAAQYHHGGGSYHGGYGYHGGNRYYGGHYYHRGDSTGAAIAGGIVGLALGAAIAGDHHRGYYDNYYGGPYYGGGYYGGGYYGTCIAHREVWDPYIGAYVRQRYAYPC